MQSIENDALDRKPKSKASRLPRLPCVMPTNTRLPCVVPTKPRLPCLCVCQQTLQNCRLYSSLEIKPLRGLSSTIIKINLASTQKKLIRETCESKVSRNVLVEQ